MPDERPTGDSDWDAALVAAFAGPKASTIAGLVLFLEDREDAVVELSDRDGVPVVRRSRTRGLSARGAFPDGRVAYRGDPEPGDVDFVTRTLVDPMVAAEGAATESGGEDGRNATNLPVSSVREFLEALVGETRRLQPTATISARWVGFQQDVRVARSGRSVVSDTRRGGRVRLEASGSGAAPVTAVMEAVMPLDLRNEAAVLGRLPEATARRLDERRRSRTMPPGVRTVVFGPGVGGILVHEVVGHALEADAVLAGRSWMSGVGEPVAPVDLTVIDDPRRSRAAWKVDDEGEPSRPVALVREGSISGWLHDLRTSRESGQPATGHGRRGSYREPVRPRMGCTFVAAGPHHCSETLEGVHDGVYIRRMEAAHTDPHTGRAIFRVTDADRIHRGRLDTAVAPHLIEVDGKSALANIERIASDLTFDCCVGSCVRDGQPLAVSVGAPTFRIGMARVTS